MANHTSTEKGTVRVSSLHGKDEKAENVEIASYLANKYGYEIDLIEKSNIPGVKSADTFNKTLEIKQEYKRIHKPTKSAVDNALRGTKEQAKHIVLDIKTDISNGDLRDSIQDRVKRSTWIEEVLVIRNGIDKTYLREDILKENWTL